MELKENELEEVVGGLSADSLVYDGKKSRIATNGRMDKKVKATKTNLVYKQSNSDLLSGDVLSKGTMC